MTACYAAVRLIASDSSLYILMILMKCGQKLNWTETVTMVKLHRAKISVPA